MGVIASKIFNTAAAQRPSLADRRDAMPNVEIGVAEPGPSTPGRARYYSPRSAAMARSKSEFPDSISQEIEYSKSHWSEVTRVEVAALSPEEEDLNRDNKEVFQELRQKYRIFVDGDNFTLDKMIAEGGQGEIYEVKGMPYHVMKVFKSGTSIRELQKTWPTPVLTNQIYQCIEQAMLLPDGRFAFLLKRCWGDLRKLIDQAMQSNGNQGPPFPYKWIENSDRTFHAVDFMSGIALGMKRLHAAKVVHRDLKAANILLNFPNLLGLFFQVEPRVEPRGYNAEDLTLRVVVLADFESSIGVKGTGYFRAPEVLVAIEERESLTHEQWERADVYSFGMTCFEIVTGKLPFEGELAHSKAERKLVIDGKRPELPSDLDPGVRNLITSCWDPNPSLRPSFREIQKQIAAIIRRQCGFRLFNMKDRLPPRYRLATVEEVREFSMEAMKAMPGWEIVNLADGSIDGFRYGNQIRESGAAYRQNW